MSTPDLEVRKREISALVDGVNDLERGLPQIEGLEDFDRLEALDIVNRIERKMLAHPDLLNSRATGAQREPSDHPTGAYQEAETG